MPLLGRGYKAAATAELERSIRKLKERDLAARKKSAFDKSVAEVQSNLNLAERLNLITAMQAQAYRQRVLVLQEEFERFREAEERDGSTGGGESSREPERYQNMDDYNSKIAKARAGANRSANAPNRAEMQEEVEHQH